MTDDEPHASSALLDPALISADIGNAESRNQATNPVPRIWSDRFPRRSSRHGLQHGRQPDDDSASSMCGGSSVGAQRAGTSEHTLAKPRRGRVCGGQILRVHRRAAGGFSVWWSTGGHDGAPRPASIPIGRQAASSSKRQGARGAGTGWPPESRSASLVLPTPVPSNLITTTSLPSQIATLPATIVTAQ